MARARRQAGRNAGRTVGALLLTLVLSACQPLLLPQPAGDHGGALPAVRTDEMSDAIANIEKDRLTIDIHSRSGIGHAEISLGRHPVEQIVLRLHLSGLEEFRLVHDQVEVTASVSSVGDSDVRQSVVVGQGDAVSITEESRYWLDIEVLSANGEPAAGIPLEDGYFQIVLRPDFVEGDQDSFTVSWVDFYR